MKRKILKAAAKKKKKTMLANGLRFLAGYDMISKRDTITKILMR